ncbi:hypothetical protein EBR57_04665, partial [bacterium]|nr:hypothetical protein [bacterium]
GRGCRNLSSALRLDAKPDKVRNVNVASVDVETRRLLDIRWTAESVTPEQRQMIDDRLSAVIGSVIPESGDVGGFGGLVGWEAF